MSQNRTTAIIDYQSDERARVNDYWVCQHCKSLNRVGTGKCYRCKQKYGSEPKQVAPVRRATEPASTTPGSRPIPGAPAPASFFTGSAVSPGVVGPGGVPVDPRLDSELPAYLSRPIQGPALTSNNFLAAQDAAQHAGPLGSLRSRLIAWLAARQSVSVWFVGYVSAALIGLLLVVGVLLLTTTSSAIRVALQTASLSQAWKTLGPGGQSTLIAMAVVFVVVGVLALIFFSAFVGLTTHNAAGYRMGELKLTQGPATTCWWKAVWAQTKLAAGFLVPAVLLVEAPRLPGSYLPGLIAAFVAVEWAQRSLNDPFGFVTNPADHLADLYGRMGLTGDGGSMLGSIWRYCFVAANALLILAYALPVIGFSIVAAAAVAGRTDLLAGHVAGMQPAQMAFLVVVLPALLAVAASLALLVPIAIDMVGRQGTRRTAARVGRPRSWLEPPGERRSGFAGFGSLKGSPERPPEPDSRYGPYDRDALVGGPSGGYGQDRGYSQDQGYGQDQGHGQDQGYETRESGGYGQDRGYETRESGGYDDRGFGTGDSDRGY